MAGRISLAGVFPPIATPFDEQGELHLEALVENLHRLNGYDLAGYVVLGSNGEAVFLSEEEKQRVWETARRAIPSDKLMIAGAGCESTRQTIELCKRAADAGADAVMIVTPHYYSPKMASKSLIRHYEAVADESPVPVILYTVPKFTHVDIDAATVAHLSRHPNVIGIKDSSGNLPKLADIVRLASPDFQLLAGSASFFLPGLVIGAVGGVLALANIAPAQCVKLYRLFREGKMREAAELQRWMLPVNAAVTSRFGIAGLKAAMDMLGYYGGPVRSPLVDLSLQERETLRSILIEAGLL